LDRGAGINVTPLPENLFNPLKTGGGLGDYVDPVLDVTTRCISALSCKLFDRTSQLLFYLCCPITNKQSVIQMKIANIVTSAILAVAVIVLFVLHFSGNGKQVHSGEGGISAELASPSDISIAYFNMDSVMAQWDLYFDYQQELGQKQSELESDFAGRTETFYQSVQDAQYKIQRGLVTRSEAEQLQQQLESQQQNLANLQNQYASQLQEESLVKQRKLIDMIERYVTELSKEKGYSYVYSYQFGGNLIYGAKPYDITNEVVAGLNAKYKPGTSLE
jgi:outer membrane protein